MFNTFLTLRNHFCPLEPNRAVDPLAEFIGAVSHGSLAANLDDELYGS